MNNYDNVQSQNVNNYSYIEYGIITVCLSGTVLNFLTYIQQQFALVKIRNRVLFLKDIGSEVVVVVGTETLRFKNDHVTIDQENCTDLSNLW